VYTCVEEGEEGGMGQVRVCAGEQRQGREKGKRERERERDRETERK